MNQNHAIIDLMLVLKSLDLEQPYRHNILTIAPIDQCSFNLTTKITHTFNEALWSFRFMFIHMGNKVTAK